MQIITGKIPGALKVALYGPEGIGKSTFASKWPDPLFIDTEDSTVHMDVRRLPKPEYWTELLNEVDWVYSNPTCCKTLVVDTADWAERLCIEFVCADKQVDSLEAFAYGKGYVFVQEKFGHLLDKLENVRKKGIHILIIAHSKLQKFEQPDELGAYDRWSMKLSKQVGPMLREWVDALFFANYKTIVINVDNKGAAKGKNKVQGGKRVMYTTHMPCWDAKNRFGLPDETEFSYEVIRPIIEGAAKPAVQAAGEKVADKLKQALNGAVNAAATFSIKEGNEAPKQEPPSALAQAVERASKPKPAPEEKPQTSAEAPKPAPALEGPYPELPPSLSRQFLEANVTPDEVRYVIAQRGVYPAHTPWSVICANDQFVRGWLQSPAVWPKVVEMIEKNRTEEELPF